jgi:hypothetical protein
MLGEDGIAAARHQTYVDFAFLIAYPLALSLGCGLSEGLSGKHALMGMLMAWAVLLALPLDATENFCMLSMLNGNAAAPWPQVATVCAALKFTLAAGAFLFLAVGGMEQLALRR